MKKKIIFLSDTHNRHDEITNDLEKLLTPDSILVHAGDFSGQGLMHEVDIFFDWLKEISKKCKYVVFIAGNHELTFEIKHPWLVNLIKGLPSNVYYLEDSEIILDNIKFYGSPWQPEFYNWAFNLPRGQALANKWELIPDDTNILITHGPPWGMLDDTITGVRVGCEDLYLKVTKIKPKIHVFGHIHYGYGLKVLDDVTYINASNLSEGYRYKNKPIDLEIDFD